MKHKAEIDKTHLRDLITDAERCKALTVEYNGVYCDYARQRVTPETMKKLYKLADAADLRGRSTPCSAVSTSTPRRTARASRGDAEDKVINVDGKNVVPMCTKSWIRSRTSPRRCATASGWATGKPLTSVVAAASADRWARSSCTRRCARARRLRRARAGASCGSSRTSTRWTWRAAERARPGDHAGGGSVEDVHHGGDDAQRAHGEAMDHRALGNRRRQAHGGGFHQPAGFRVRHRPRQRVRVLGLGRRQVQRVLRGGMLPLSLQYGYDTMETFLEGAWNVDEHRHGAVRGNLPVTLDASLWNVSFLDCPARAILPYTQALAKLAPHIQQVAMESNGKGVSIDGQKLDYEAGRSISANLEPTASTRSTSSSTKGAHPVRLHQDHQVAAVRVPEGRDRVQPRRAHVQLFAQADALAVGKATCTRSENARFAIPHKTFTGNRPSLSIMLPSLNAYTTGQILAIYEHRVATQGFIWGLNC